MLQSDTELEAPIHEALTRDILVMGCERNAFTLLALGCAVLAMVGFLDDRFGLVVGSALLFFGSVVPLQRMTKDDPKAPVIWIRSLGARRIYDAAPRWDQPRLRQKRSRFGEE